MESSNTPSANQLQPQEVFIKVQSEEMDAVCYWSGRAEGWQRTDYVKPITAIVLSESELKREKEESIIKFFEWAKENEWRFEAGIWAKVYYDNLTQMEVHELKEWDQIISLYNQSLNPQHQ